MVKFKDINIFNYYQNYFNKGNSKLRSLTELTDEEVIYITELAKGLGENNLITFNIERTEKYIKVNLDYVIDKSDVIIYYNGQVHTSFNEEQDHSWTFNQGKITLFFLENGYDVFSLLK